MPASGRDVQCSNCGQTWFQHHPDFEPDEDKADQDTPTSDEEIAPPPPPHTPERKELDPAVAEILRQEAEAEKAARRTAQSATLESQPELGMDLEEPEQPSEADRRAREARDRMARLRGSEPVEEGASAAPVAVTATAAASTGSRRDLLPDIEEINSTLRTGSGRSSADAEEIGPDFESPTHRRKRRGFRTGFLTMMLIFIVLAVLYVLAPRLAAAVPALEAPLAAYVNTVDQGRVWLDEKVQGLLRSLDSMAEGSNN